MVVVVVMMVMVVLEILLFFFPSLLAPIFSILGDDLALFGLADRLLFFLALKSNSCCICHESNLLW